MTKVVGSGMTSAGCAVNTAHYAAIYDAFGRFVLYELQRRGRMNFNVVGGRLCRWQVELGGFWGKKQIVGNFPAQPYDNFSVSR